MSATDNTSPHPADLAFDYTCQATTPNFDGPGRQTPKSPTSPYSRISNSAPVTRRYIERFSSENIEALQHMRSKMAGLKHKIKTRRGSSARREGKSSRIASSAASRNRRLMLDGSSGELLSPVGAPVNSPLAQYSPTLTKAQVFGLGSPSSAEANQKRSKGTTGLKRASNKSCRSPARSPMNSDSDATTNTVNTAPPNSRFFRASSSNERSNPSTLSANRPPIARLSNSANQKKKAEKDSYSNSAIGSGKWGEVEAVVLKVGAEYAGEGDLEPLDDPQRDMRKAMHDIKASDWSTRFKAMNHLRRLAMHHKDVLKPYVKSASTLLKRNLDSLRSIEAKNAILTIHDFVRSLKKGMDSAADTLIPALLKRAGETSGFIAIEAEKTLDQMVNHLTKTRLLTSLLAAFHGGKGEAAGKTKAIRQRCAEFIYKTVKALGSRVSTCKDLEKLLKTMGMLLNEGSLSTRKTGKKLVFQMANVMGETELVRMSSRAITSQDLKALHRTLEKGEIPAEEEIPDLKFRRSTKLSFSRTNSKHKLHRSHHDSQKDLIIESKQAQASGGGRREGKKIRHQRDISEDSNLGAIFNNMDGKKDWRTRISGIEALGKLLESDPTAIRYNCKRVLERLRTRLEDGNSKVNIVALQTLGLMTQQLKSLPHADTPVRNTLVLSIASHVGSSNVAVRKAATAVIDTYIARLDSAQLIQPLANATLFGKPSVRPMMLQKLLPMVESTSAPLVRKHLVPLSVGLIKATNVPAEVRDGNKRLLRSLYDVLGPGLFEVPVVRRLDSQQLDRLKRTVAL